MSDTRLTALETMSSRTSPRASPNHRARKARHMPAVSPPTVTNPSLCQVQTRAPRNGWARARPRASDEASVTLRPLRPMVLDLLNFRTHEGGEPEDVRESQRRRGADVGLVDAVIAADVLWRRLQHVETAARAALTQAKRSLRPPAATAADGTATAAETPAAPPPPTRDELAVLSRNVADAGAAAQAAQSELQSLLLRIGNLVHEDAPSGCALETPLQLAVSPAIALRRLVADGLAEELPACAGGKGGVAWRASGMGMLLQHQWVAHALRMVATRGFVPLATPLHPPAHRLSKLAKLARERGEPTSQPPLPAGRAAIEPLGALYACSWLTPASLPLRHAMLLTPTDDVGSLDGRCDEAASGCGDTSASDATVGCGDAVGPQEVWVSLVCADDGSSCWAALEELCDLARAVHEELHGLPTQTSEVRAKGLAHTEARAFTIYASCTAEEGNNNSCDEFVLARACCEYDYRARRLGVRCGAKALGERTKRHVHSLHACILRPSSALLALGARRGDMPVIGPEMRRRWLEGVS